MSDKKLYMAGDLVEVIPEMMDQITYTNKPWIGYHYIIRTVFGGDTWTYGLNNIHGHDANIHISHEHIKLVKE